MADAPKRIWLQLGAGDEGTHTWADHQVGWDDDGEYEPEYIRADVAEAENKRLREALRKIGENAKICAYGSDHIICHNCSDTHHAVDAALQENHDD